MQYIPSWNHVLTNPLLYTKMQPPILLRQGYVGQVNADERQ
jgi:hypothetical protein